MKKRVLSILLCAAVLCAVFAGCGEETPEQHPSVQPETVQSSQSVIATSTAAPTELSKISWSEAFRVNDLAEDGELFPDQIAFLQLRGDGTKSVVTVPRTEVLENQAERLPRSRYFEQYLSTELTEELLPALDYAMAHGFGCLCIPVSRLSCETVKQESRWLAQTYRIDDSDNSAFGVEEVGTSDGQTLTCLLITVGGMETREMIDKYLAGMEAARAIVATIPVDMEEQEIMYYLYHWLTIQISCEDSGVREEENSGNASWRMVYDALVNRSTVSAGYAEAMYVLCNLAGIDCIAIEGDVVTDEAPERHTWNVTRVCGKYYQFDSAQDAGLTAADYMYYGDSDAQIMALRNQSVSSFAEEYCPPCKENLIPPVLAMPEDQQSPEYSIVWYYRLRNARNTDPMKLFSYFGWDEDRVGAEEPRDGLVRTKLDINKLIQGLTVVMTREQALRFNLEYYMNESSEDTFLSFRLPAENPELTRLTGLEDNGDGSWTAQVYRFLSDGTLYPDTETVTMEESNGYWYVVFVK